MKKKAFIFDVDGTLLDSLQQHEDSFYAACEEFNVSLNSDIKLQLSGLTSIEKTKFLIKNGLIKDVSDIAWIIERKNDISLDLCFNTYKPLMQHIDAMNVIHDELNCRIVLCSNSPRKFVDKFVHKCGFENIISFSLSGEDVRYKKPDPDIYTKACSFLSISPEECVIFEDSEEGIIAASKAGCCDIIKVNHPLDITPFFIQKIINKFNIRYFNSKYLVYK